MRHVLLPLFLFLLIGQLSSQSAYFFPKEISFDPAIPSPEAFLGYPIGSRHTRHDRIAAYFERLATLSPKAEFRTIGYTQEHRPQIVLTVTDPENLRQLETIRKAHLAIADTETKTDLSSSPVVVLLGYGVHGNEASSAEAAMLAAYWLVAAQGVEMDNLRRQSVTHIDPVYNPDGRDRHTHWVNMHLADPPVADPNDREHNEVWPGGRTNHYWFDLNRDWLPLAQVESRNRMDFYHLWLPNVATDYHEMGTNATYFFEPTKPVGSENPLVPRRNYEELNQLFARYFQRALDDIGSLYYTRESFDNSYPGYGSTYPDMQGGLGLLFEQASSRGHRQHTSTKDIIFAFTIRNQLRTSLATVQAAVENRQTLLDYQRWFFETAIAEAAKGGTKGWVFGDANDLGKSRAFLDLLHRHRIKVFKLEEPLNMGNRTWQPGQAWVVPAAQAQYRLAATFFEPRTNTSIPDSVFYDASAWTVALAFDMPFARLRQLPRLTLRSVPSDTNVPAVSIPQANYAWLINWSDYGAARVLHNLLKNGVYVKTAFEPFSALTTIGQRDFPRGTLLVPVADQNLRPDSIHQFLKVAVEQTGTPVFAVNTGLSRSGVDLGSPAWRTIQRPHALMLIGEGVSSYEAGEVWHLLDQRVGMPITKVDVNDLSGLNLYEYNTLILVSGRYRFGEEQLRDLRKWIQAGNTLITIRQATQWAIEQKLAEEKLIPSDEDSAVIAKRLDFATARENAGIKRIGGVVFNTDVDISHPLAFGLNDRELPVYRNHEIVVAPSANPFSTVVAYADAPQLDGYVHPNLLLKVKKSASLLVSKSGRGRVILFVDNPNFRGFWYGTNRLFFNALFLGSLVGVP